MQKLCCVHTRQQFSASLDYFVTSSPPYLHQFSTISGGNFIIPELCDITLQYLAGSYTDIFFLVGISQSSFFHLLWKTIKAINKCAELQITWPYTKEQQIECACGFTSISTNCALCECVAVLDGYHLQTTTPSKKKST